MRAGYLHQLVAHWEKELREAEAVTPRNARRADAARAGLEATKNTLAKLEQEARLKGVPAGWLR